MKSAYCLMIIYKSKADISKKILAEFNVFTIMNNDQKILIK